MVQKKYQERGRHQANPSENVEDDKSKRTCYLDRGLGKVGLYLGNDFPMNGVTQASAGDGIQSRLLGI